MEQFINTNQEDNNTVTQVTLEGRANQIYEYILNNCGDLHLANFHQHLDELSGKIFLSDEEKKAVLPYILNKITQKIITDYSQKSIVLDFGSIADPKQFLMIALNQLFIEMILDQKKGSTFDYLPLNEAAAGGVQVGYISIIKHLLLLGQSNNERTFIKQHDVQSQFFGFALELYPLGSYHRSPGYWIDMFQKLQGNQREFLKSVPFVWGEKDFRSYVQSGINQSHVRINGKQYKINGKAKDRWKKVEKNQKKMEKQGWKRQMIIEDKAITKAITLDTSDKPQWCVYMTMHDEGPSIEYVPTYNNKLFAFEMKFNGGIRSEISLNRTITHKIDEEECDKNMSNIFQDILIPYGQFFDEQIFVTSLDNLREFDIQNSTQKTPTTSVVESVAQDATTLVSTAFVDPKTHHVDVARSLGLDVIDHSEDIGTSEAASHIKYANSHGNSSLHYIPKIAWLIDMLEDIIPKNKYGKITAHTLPSSPYIFIYTDKGTIFISDVDNVGTQVFAQKVDPEYINHDFSFPKLGQLFGPYTSIKNNFGEIISDESADIWAKNITDALAKKDGYFLDLMNDEQNHWLANFRKMYESGSITKADFATPTILKQFLENYNSKLLLRSDLTTQEKQILSFTNSRGSVPPTQVIINAFGGHSFFTFYHGHTLIFCEYFDALLLNDREKGDMIFQKLRSSHTVYEGIQSWIGELKNGTRMISEAQFQGLFSLDKNIKKSMRTELNVPSGLFSSVSWIIALGHDPEQSAEGETMEAYLYRILIEEGILKNKI